MPNDAAFAHAIPSDAKIYVAGHKGLVGSAVWRHLRTRGYENVVGRTSAELDLRDRAATFDFFAAERPEYVIDAAAKVGGIIANINYPAEMISDNLRIQVNVLDAAHEFAVRRLLFLGSSCIYPKHAPQPITEDAVLTGPLEPTNDAYSVAKLAGVFQVQAMRRQYGSSFISVMPTNLYGPGDNFDPETSHLMPLVIRRMHEAVESGADQVVFGGTGTPRREFLHVDDLAAACLVLLERYDDPAPINVGTGVDITVEETARLVADVAGFEGEILFNRSIPDGTPRKVLDILRINALGWKPGIELRQGVEDTLEWYRKSLANS